MRLGLLSVAAAVVDPPLALLEAKTMAGMSKADLVEVHPTFIQVSRSLALVATSRNIIWRGVGGVERYIRYTETEDSADRQT